ncbi:hypothetical protein LTR85_007790 [Meristemomyces frigidus]|nr:hypothetical protein LTR85_007790 [Meristemomyces frigidus]
MAPSAPPGFEAIAGLRQQITANAIALFPKVVDSSPQKSEAFDIIVSLSSDGMRYQAVISCITDQYEFRTIAAEGPKSDTVASALGGLLDVTAMLVEESRYLVLGHLVEGGQAFAGGHINTSLLRRV